MFGFVIKNNFRRSQYRAELECIKIYFLKDLRIGVNSQNDAEGKKRLWDAFLNEESHLVVFTVAILVDY